MSIASDQPGRGNDSGPAGAGPKRFSVPRNGAQRCCCTASRIQARTFSWPSGTTNWYWSSPRGPTARFHPSTASSRWKNRARPATPLCSCGARRNHRLLKPRADQGVTGQNGTAGARRARGGR